MQALSHLPAVPLDPPEIGDTTPYEVAAILAGSREIVLAGFAESRALTGAWQHPNTPFLAAVNYERDLPVILCHAGRWKRTILGAWILGAAAIAFAAGSFISILSVDWTERANASVASWSITGFSQGGVLVEMAGKTTAVPMGARLPNGELVVQTMPEKRLVLLERSTIYLRPSVMKDSTK